MQLLLDIGLVLAGYLLGSIPFGLLIVRMATGKDIRQVESGRTGGTNAMRAAGFWAGLGTALMDILKGVVATWLAQSLSPGNHLIHILAPLASILGHNYSAFLPEFNEAGKFVRLRGGAGGAPALGGAIGLWPPSVFIILPLGALVFFTAGYASITTLSIGFFATLIFALRAYWGEPGADWLDVWYGAASLVLLIWALRPNIQKLFSGNERVVGISLHGRLKTKQEKKNAAEAIQEID